MSYGTYNFFRLGVAVKHVSQVFHFSHLSSLAEMRYWGLTFFLVFRGQVHLGLFFRGRCGRPYYFSGMVILNIFWTFTPESCRAFLALYTGATLATRSHLDFFGW